MSTTVNYKGSQLVQFDNSTKVLKTQGKYLEDDITIQDVSSSVTVEALNATQNGTYEEAGKAYSPVVVNVPSGIKKYPEKYDSWYKINIQGLSGTSFVTPRYWFRNWSNVDYSAFDGSFSANDNTLRFNVMVFPDLDTRLKLSVLVEDTFNTATVTSSVPTGWTITAGLVTINFNGYKLLNIDISIPNSAVMPEPIYGSDAIVGIISVS